MFNYVDKFTGTGLSEWNVGLVQTFAQMFQQAKVFNGDLSKWNTGSATDMSAAFAQAPMFNSDIANWDTSKVTNMWRMFYLAKAFNIDISRWDVGKVTRMTSMFNGAESFSHTLCGVTWRTSIADQSGGMFTGTKSGSITWRECGSKSS